MADTGLEAFLAKVHAIADGWAALDRAQGLAAADKGAAAAQVRAIPFLELESSPLIVRAAGLLQAWGELDGARGLLAEGAALGGPAPPFQLAFARSLRAARDFAAARLWYRGAVLRAAPDAALMLELAACEQEAGKAETATAIAAVAPRFSYRNWPGIAEAGRALRGLGRHDLAVAAFLLAFRAGERAPALLADILAEQADGHADLGEPYVAALPGGPSLGAAVATMAAQAKLAAAHDRWSTIGAAAQREASPAFIACADLHALLAHRIAEREPFSWIRLGDGEARFLLARKPDLRGPLEAEEARTVGGFIWSIWFGQDMAATDPVRLDQLEDAFDRAIENADLLGLPTARRLGEDAAHFGYCAALERHVGNLPPRAGRCFCDAGGALALNQADPVLMKLLGGLDFLGVIGPHPDLAGRLQRRLGIGAVASYDIPGEGRLKRPRDAEDRGRHFPEVFDRIMAELTVPYRGAVFLVAGGLLGKIYCDRIRELGGIALDIGALADAWMGINSRGAALNGAMKHALPA